MPLTLRSPTPASSPDASFTFERFLSPSDNEIPVKEEYSIDVASLPSPPTEWLSAKDMKMFGASPLMSSNEIGIVRCKDCQKPILRSAVTEHADNCRHIRLGAPKKKGKNADGDDGSKKSKKRRADDIADDGTGPPNKRARPAPKITKGRFKGPVDFDKQCGVINDKNLPCSRSLTCKSHSMGAKRSVQGRSRPYDELLLDWNRAHNPNFVEPVKRETKAEKKEKREREREEKRRAKELEGELKKGQKKVTKGTTKKKGSKDAKATGTVGNEGEEEGEGPEEDIDSEAELDILVKALRTAKQKGMIGVPLATADEMNAGTFFVARRERLRNCRDLIAGALNRRTISAAGSRVG